jgi:hypothetical protein
VLLKEKAEKEEKEEKEAKAEVTSQSPAIASRSTVS